MIEGNVTCAESGSRQLCLILGASWRFHMRSFPILLLPAKSEGQKASHSALQQYCIHHSCCCIVRFCSCCLQAGLHPAVPTTAASVLIGCGDFVIVAVGQQNTAASDHRTPKSMSLVCTVGPWPSMTSCVRTLSSLVLDLSQNPKPIDLQLSHIFLDR